MANNPKLANDPENAAKILAYFFKEKGIDKLIEEGKIVEARRLVNPDDKGEMISETMDTYLKSLQ